MLMKRLVPLGLLLAGALRLPAVMPLPVDDLQIQLVDAGTLRFLWSPVAQDVDGQPLACVEYALHGSSSARFEPEEATWITTTSATELDLALAGEAGYYRVLARSCAAGSPLDLLLIPAGVITMGNPSTPQFWVDMVITRDFLLGRTAVTNQQYLEALQWAWDQGLLSIVGDHVRQHGQNLLRINQSGADWHEIRFDANSQQFYLHAGTHISGGGCATPCSWGPGHAYPAGYDPAGHPVKWVSWFGAACYCDWRSQMDGLPPYYNGQWSQIPSPDNPYLAEGYRLPTDAEWELAARYPNDMRRYPWGDSSPSCAKANYAGLPNLHRCVGWTMPAGSLPDGASALGLLDLSGNVHEWCNDWWQFTPVSQTDPVGPATGSTRLFRGGGWDEQPGGIYSYNRYGASPGQLYSNMGFRLCRTAP
ncbi:MAG: SUMF1/EgtB/PvdO family nonheme iron enzyme [bacterium]|nr:SUMF1/EgtB/PvdO family nonheme iron enzyme [bacterium]